MGRTISAKLHKVRKGAWEPERERPGVPWEVPRADREPARRGEAPQRHRASVADPSRPCTAGCTTRAPPAAGALSAPGGSRSVFEAAAHGRRPGWSRGGGDRGRRARAAGTQRGRGRAARRRGRRRPPPPSARRSTNRRRPPLVRGARRFGKTCRCRPTGHDGDRGTHQRHEPGRRDGDDGATGNGADGAAAMGSTRVSAYGSESVNGSISGGGGSTSTISGCVGNSDSVGSFGSANGSVRRSRSSNAGRVGGSTSTNGAGATSGPGSSVCDPVRVSSKRGCAAVMSSSPDWMRAMRSARSSTSSFARVITQAPTSSVDAGAASVWSAAAISWHDANLSDGSRPPPAGRSRRARAGSPARSDWGG